MSSRAGCGSAIVCQSRVLALRGVRGDGLLGEAEVSEARVARLVEQDVLGLKVSVDHVHAVQVAWLGRDVDEM